jgi:hypothetical protein
MKLNCTDRADSGGLGRVERVGAQSTVYKKSGNQGFLLGRVSFFSGALGPSTPPYYQLRGAQLPTSTHQLQNA